MTLWEGHSVVSHHHICVTKEPIAHSLPIHAGPFLLDCLINEPISTGHATQPVSQYTLLWSQKPLIRAVELWSSPQK
jgi:hypothetical protein